MYNCEYYLTIFLQFAAQIILMVLIAFHALEVLKNHVEVMGNAGYVCIVLITDAK